MKSWESVVVAGAHFFKCTSIHPAQSEDCSEGRGETVSCSNWDLIKISAQLSGLSWAMYSTPKTTDDPCKAIDCSVIDMSSLICKPLQRHRFIFSPRHEFPLEPHFTLCRHTAHIKLPLQCYLTGGCKQRQHVGHLEDEGAASHVAALILYKAHVAHAHSHILACRQRSTVFNISIFSDKQVVWLWGVVPAEPCWNDVYNSFKV